MQRLSASSRVRQKSASAEDAEAWRRHNIGRLLSNALHHFEERVIELLQAAGHDEVKQSHINATRNLDVAGTRLTEMAQRAAMTKQSMSELVLQIEGRGLVVRTPDPSDGRARIVRFTPAGLKWLRDFRDAVRIAEAEMAAQIGTEALAAMKDALIRYRAEPVHDESPS